MENTSLRSRVFHQIRNDILNGKYQKGDELTESALGKALGVSRTPVREALRQLALEGLVENVPNRGTFVTGISSQDVAPSWRDCAPALPRSGSPQSSSSSWRRLRTSQIITP